MRPRTESADRGAAGLLVGTAAGFFGAAEPGMRWAFGTRFGRPAWVCASGTWFSKDSAACHPSSPGDVHSLLRAAAGRAGLVGSGAEPLRAAGVSGCC